jgi:hypothetical protein
MPSAVMIVLAAAVLVGAGHQPDASRTTITVLSIDLNNLTNSAPDPALPSRILDLAAALRATLAGPCGYEVVDVDPAAEAAAHATDGYFYAHPDVAASLARSAGAEWVIVPRVNRASPWVADLQAHVVRVSDTMLLSNRIVEIKGIELDSALAARLAERGGAWMADQISQAIERAINPGNSLTRRCPA